MMILFMCIRFWQYLDSATCLLGSQPNLDFAYVQRFLLNIDSITCLLGGLQNIDFAYVRKVLPEY